MSGEVLWGERTGGGGKEGPACYDCSDADEDVPAGHDLRWEESVQFGCCVNHEFGSWSLAGASSTIET